MERLNWAVLGLIGIVTALGLGTSSGAGKTKTDEQPVRVTVSSDAPACSACQATGACCEQSANKKESGVSIERSSEVFDVKVSGNSKAWVIDGTGTCKPVSGEIASTDCPLTKAAEMIENLTKNYVCEGGECLNKPGQGTLTIKTVDPAPAQPEGLSNLLAAAEAVHQEAKPVSGAGEIVTGGLTIDAKPSLNLTTGTLTLTGTADTTKAASGTLTINAIPNTKGIAIVTAQSEAKPAIDNSRAAARAAKLAKLEAKMEEPWTLACNETPLNQAVAALQTKLGVPVLLDAKALEDSGIDPGTPLTADQQPEIETGELLRGCLRNHGLTWIIPASNDRILITSLQAMEQTSINRVYEVTDLIDENHGTEAIIERIQSLVEPSTWKANGGQGDLTVWQKGNRVSLICSNTYWAQRAIAELLEDLRLNSGEAGTHAAIRANQPDVAVLKNYELPSLFNIKEQKDKQKQLETYKQSLLNVLKNEPGFDGAIFETLEFGNRTVLMTKQLPAVHQQIQRVLQMLKQHPGFGGSVIPVVGSKAYPNFF
jgi:hypothetical protein